MIEQIHFFETLQQPKPVIQAAPQKTEKPAYFKCPHCPCIFFSDTDQRNHLKKFGFDAPTHNIRWHDAMKRRNAGIE